MPPTIELLGHEVKGDKLMLRVKAHDGGDGVSVVRRWKDGLPYQEPVAIGLEQEIPIGFEFKKKRLPREKDSIYKYEYVMWPRHSLSVQACNKLGHVCSRMIECSWNREDEHVTCR